MEFKSYMKGDFDKWCEDNPLSEEYSDSLWGFIEGQDVNLNLTPQQGDETKAVLTISTKLRET